MSQCAELCEQPLSNWPIHVTLVDDQVLAPHVVEDFVTGQGTSDVAALNAEKAIDMNVACPKCSTVSELLEGVQNEVLCPSCGTRINERSLQTSQHIPDYRSDATSASSDATVNEKSADGDIAASYLVTTPNHGVRPLLTTTGHAELRAAFTSGNSLQNRYLLEREVGRGGMGQVYLGRDTRLGRPVAIKVMLPTLDDPSSRESSERSSGRHEAFIQEARLGANLLHPAIATVFDFGFHEGKPFTVFEYIDGEALSDLLRRRKRLPLDEVRLIIRPLAQALDYAHSQHVVHRDLKPANIRATAQGEFKILDLGLAKEFRRQVDWSGFAGTPAYASPEQASGLPSDGRTDQYALALIAYEMLTGRRPFQSADLQELLRMHREQEPPPPQSVGASLPESISSALMQALRKHPNERFATCEQFAVALGCQFLSDSKPLPEILLEADARMVNRFWSFRTKWQNLTGHTQRVHLVLTPDALWLDHHAESLRLPLGSIQKLKRRQLSRDMTFSVTSANGSVRRKIRFRKRRECREWFERLHSLAKTLPDESKLASSGAPVKPVTLLRQRPNARFQFLGQVETSRPKRWSAEAGLRMRGAMIGADAVIEVREERLTSFSETVRRLSGTAIQTVDQAGAIEVGTRAFNEQAARWSLRNPDAVEIE